MKKIILSLFVAAAFTLGNAQVKTPQASPSSTVKQTVGLSEITVEYSRPSAKERKIFGDLVPEKELWRTGANGSTDITFNTNVNFGGTDVPAGKYAIYTIPGAGEWQIFLYKDTELWGTPEKIDEALVVAKTSVKTEKIAPPVESFTIGFDDLKSSSANLVLAWENTWVEIPISVDSKEEVLKSIDSTLNSDKATARDYHSAAGYYLEEKLDAKQALEWSKKANDMSPDTFYMLKLQAELEAETGDRKAAIETANKSLELAEKAGNQGYVDMNRKNIDEWSK